MNNVELEASGNTTWRMVKSTAIIGGSNAIATLMRIVRMKVFAVFLGPAGMGLVGLYSSLMSTVTTISEMGVGSSGVRQVADANDDQRRIAGTLFTLRSVAIFLGTVGALSLIFLSKAVSRWTFGNYDYVKPIVVLSSGVLFAIISDSQTAILNGLRRVGDLARINVIGSGIGTILAILIVWSKGASALAYAIIVPMLGTLACSWWFVRRVPLPRRKPPWPELKGEALSLLRLGLAFMFAGLMMTGALLLTRVIFLQRLGLAATGLFQAAWAIVVINIEFILNAMGVDFYPHLTACIKRDESTGNRLVNEQTEVALLIGGPLIIGMLTVASVLIRVFYSGKFALAAELLRWLLLGSILKLVSWPLGYLIMAHAWAKTSILVELVWCLSYVSLVYVGCPYFGINCAGYAFLAAYLIYVVVVYIIAHSLGGFRWTRANMRLTGALFMAGMAVMVLVSTRAAASYLIGGLVTLAFSIFSIQRLCGMVDHPIAKRIALLVGRKAMPFAAGPTTGP